MTISERAYSGESALHPGETVKGYWCNDGTFLVTLGRGYSRNLVLLASELKEILAAREWTGEVRQRPNTFRIEFGRVYSEADGDALTVYEQHIGSFVPINGNELARLAPEVCSSTNSLKLLRSEWQQVYDACMAHRDATVAKHGRPIQPAGGIHGMSAWDEELAKATTK